MAHLTLLARGCKRACWSFEQTCYRATRPSVRMLAKRHLVQSTAVYARLLLPGSLENGRYGDPNRTNLHVCIMCGYFF